MESTNKLLDACVKWFSEEENVRCVILIGSRAQKGEADRLAGIDLDLFVQDPDALIENSGWLEVLEKPLLTDIDNEEDLIIWRGIFENGLLLALFIQPLSTLTAIQKTLPPYYLPQYKVLIDKDDQTAQFPKPIDDTTSSPQPTPEAFQACLTRFWLQVYFTMKCIWRKDLWRAKHYDWQAKQELLQMLGWHAAVCEDQKGFTTIEGDQIITWVNSNTYSALKNTFGHFDSDDSWYALGKTIHLFSRLAKEIAGEMDFKYSQEQEKKFKSLMAGLMTNFSN